MTGKHSKSSIFNSCIDFEGDISNRYMNYLQPVQDCLDQSRRRMNAQSYRGGTTLDDQSGIGIKHNDIGIPSQEQLAVSRCPTFSNMYQFIGGVPPLHVIAAKADSQTEYYLEKARNR